MSDSFDRLELMVADLNPTDESDQGKGELVANLKRELASLRGMPSLGSTCRIGHNRTGGRRFDSVRWRRATRPGTG
jgi:hypothetical protein